MILSLHENRCTPINTPDLTVYTPKLPQALKGQDCPEIGILDSSKWSLELSTKQVCLVSWLATDCTTNDFI